VTFSIGSGERKRCSNIAPVRRFLSLAWMKARKLPGVRCSTANTECRSLLCLMIMPGRIWVAGIDIAWRNLLQKARFAEPAEGGQATFSAAVRTENLFYTHVPRKGNLPQPALIEEGPHLLPQTRLFGLPQGSLELLLLGYSRLEIKPRGNLAGIFALYEMR
jgi:hypothetical protein